MGESTSPEGTETSREGIDWHWGPDPAFGNLCEHKGPRERCTGPDCGPDVDERPTLPDDTEGTDDLLRDVANALEDLGACRDPDCPESVCRRVLPRVLAAIAKGTTITTDDGYWKAEAEKARAERDALAIGVLQLGDAWVKEFGETGIRPEVCAATIRSAVKTMGWR